MGTYHKHGYLYTASLASMLEAECEKMKEIFKKRQAEKNYRELEDFDRDYWHAMQKFALGKSTLHHAAPMPDTGGGGCSAPGNAPGFKIS
jgi:hypothetical protein